MNLRFIEYLGDIYIVVGITYDSKYHYPECFVGVPLDGKTLIRTSLEPYTLNIPFTEAIEITNKNKILSLMVLYG